MHTRFASAAVLSALLHGTAIVVLIVFSFRVRNELGAAPMLIEMVTGGGQSTASTPDVRVIIPRAPARTTEVPPHDLPAINSKPSPAATSRPNRPAPEPAVENKAVSRPPASKPIAGPARATDRTVARPPSPAATRPVVSPRVDTTWNLTADAGTGRSAAVAVDGTDRLGTELEAYFAELRRRLRVALEIPAGVSEELVVTVDVLLAADGSLSQAHIAQSSGSAEFDRAVLGAISRTRMSARPDGKTEMVTIPFTTRHGTRR